VAHPLSFPQTFARLNITASGRVIATRRPFPTSLRGAISDLRERSLDLALLLTSRFNLELTRGLYVCYTLLYSDWTRPGRGESHPRGSPTPALS